MIIRQEERKNGCAKEDKRGMDKTKIQARIHHTETQYFTKLIITSKVYVK